MSIKKNRIIALLLGCIIIISNFGFTQAESIYQNEVLFDESELQQNDLLEDVNISDVPIEILEQAEQLTDYTQIKRYIPLDIKVENGSIKTINPQIVEADEIELHILKNGNEILYYNNVVYEQLNKISAVENNMVTGIQMTEKLSSGVTYFISVKIKNSEMNIIDTYDGYFTIQGDEIVYEDIYHSQALISAIEGGIVTLAAVQNETETNDTYSLANTLVDGNTIYGKLATFTDRDWYRVKFSLDGNAKFSLTNIPVSTNYNMTVYGASSASAAPTVLYRGTNTGTASELVTLPVTSSNYYYIEVFSVQGYHASLSYVASAVNTPITDSYEPSDTLATATSITIGNTYNATLHKTADIDYFKLSYAGGLLTVNLSSIPSGTNYDLELCNSGGTKLTSSNNSGTTSESLTYSLSSGTYYIRVYSASGYSVTGKYALSTTSRPNSVNLTCTFNPKIPSNVGAAAVARIISGLPVSLYTVSTTGLETLIASGITDSSGVFSKSSISIASTVANLRVKVKFDNTTISIQKYTNSIYEFAYDINIGNLSTISVSLPNLTTIPEEQVLAYALWSNGLNLIAKANALTTTSLGKLVFKSEVGNTTGSQCSGTSYISLLGTSSEKDYLDTDVMAHEMGHWIMNKLGVRPAGTGQSHTYNGYTDEATAYREGWATFFGCSIRNNSQSLDYNSSGYFGVNISNANHKASTSSSWTLMPLHSSDHSYNQRNETNIGTIFWSYKNFKNYSNTQSLTSPTKNDMKEIYDAAISNVYTTTDKETVWNMFDARGCAFDMTLPTVSLSISGKTASVTATDNITVKKINWYVDGVLVRTVNSTTDTLSLLSYSGTVSVEVRVYDPEGLAATPRPRSQRYATATKSAILSASSAINSRSLLSDYIPNNVESLYKTENILNVESVDRYSIYTDGLEDLYIYAHIRGGIQEINIYDPSGNLFDTIPYISPDEPYIIENAQQGSWSFEFVALTGEGIFSILDAANVTIDDMKQELQSLTIDDLRENAVNNKENKMITDEIVIDTLKELITTEIEVEILAKPTKVVCEKAIFTNDTYILAKTLADEKYVSVYNNGNQIDYLNPLSDGNYNLKLIRTINGIESEVTELNLIVDTIAPEIRYENEFSTYEEGIYLHVFCSEDTVEARVNGEYMYISSISDFGYYIELTPGKHSIEIYLVDRCGNITTEVITFERLVK